MVPVGPIRHEYMIAEFSEPVDVGQETGLVQEDGSRMQEGPDNVGS